MLDSRTQDTDCASGAEEELLNLSSEVLNISRQMVDCGSRAERLRLHIKMEKAVSDSAARTS